MSKQELLYRFFEFTGNEKDSLIYLKYDICQLSEFPF